VNVSDTDRTLGMHRSITRRDFLNGVGIAIAGSALSPMKRLALGEQATLKEADYYPPAQTGMRGDHIGSFEVAHEVRDRHGWDLSNATDTGEIYDLVVVGGGISGLSAAHFFLAKATQSATNFTTTAACWR
jgi:spermidine dehydrogenase